VRERTEDVVTEGDASPFVAREVTLANHSNAVRELAADFSRRLGLDDDVSHDLALAARLHDIGKADPRFQQWLVGGSEVAAAMLVEPLAKSAAPLDNALQRRIARERSGYPAGYRHELLSVSLAQHALDQGLRAIDPELVLHLIGSHHGWARPFVPSVVDDNPTTVSTPIDDMSLGSSTDHGLARLDSGVADRFWSLNERYGWWGLAWLEAILRLADRASQQYEEVRS
jgi:CRISPR-associated endonuclease/helicase Cas3